MRNLLERDVSAWHHLRTENENTALVVEIVGGATSAWSFPVISRGEDSEPDWERAQELLTRVLSNSKLHPKKKRF